ncbi:hypothetical protein AALT_g6240 [Alternaria alternata]|nr:hypothetical protein AALT_g6240 [Alternaria alternata]
MTRPQNLARAIPQSFQALCERRCRTKTSLLIRRETNVRPRQAITIPHTKYALVTGFRSLSSDSRPPSGPAEQPKQNTPHDSIYAANQPADLPDRVQKLSSRWKVINKRQSIERKFQFAGFAKAWQFMSLVADECKVKKHHPRWTNVYNRVSIEWTTHDPKGLSIKDVEMAEFCDRKAAEVELKESPF